MIRNRKPAACMALILTIMLLASNVQAAARSSRKNSKDQLAAGGFAVLEIELQGYTEDEIHRSEWRPIKYTLSFDGVTFEGESAQIKGRGNYTWGQAKRPYAIKCDKKTDWFGFGAARDWVLLANVTDQTLMRNMVALTLAAQFNFAFTPQCRPAHVFIDGRYNGVYLITEKNEIDKERLKLDDLGGDLLLELDNNYGGGEPDAFRSALGNTFVPKDPTREELNNEPDKTVSFKQALNDAQTKLNNWETAISTLSGYKNFSQYMDMDSLVDWYIFNEIMKNDDTLFNSSIFLYNDYDGVLHMGPVWDYDLAMGGIDRNDGKNVDPTGFMFLEDYWGRPNWMIYVLKSTTFNNMVKARWQELYNSGTFEYIAAYLELQREYMRKPYEINYSVWYDSGVFVPMPSYDEAVDYLKAFIDDRVAWLNSQWNESSVTPEPVVLTPTPTAQPERTKPPASATPTAASSEPAATDDSGGSEPSDSSGADYTVLNYILLFVGTCAGSFLLISVVYLLISSRKPKGGAK